MYSYKFFLYIKTYQMDIYEKIDYDEVCTSDDISDENEKNKIHLVYVEYHPLF